MTVPGRQKLTAKAPKVEVSTLAIEQPRPVGRPRTGKRGDADFRNVIIYLREDTNAEVDEILWRRS